MTDLRAIVRLLAFMLWSVAAFVAALGVHVVVLLLPAAGTRLRRPVARVWARGVAAIIGLRIEQSGTPPEPPFVLVSNHLSYVDIVTLMASAPGVFVAKSDVAHWPFLGPLARVGSTVFVDRNSRRDVVRVNARIEHVLRRGEGLIIFPEGTSSRGAEVLPFRSSLLEPAARAGLPVSCASISYATPVGSPPAEWSVCWWGDMTFGKHFYELLRLPGIHGSVVFGQERLAGSDRHELARELQRAVSAGFRPVTDAGSEPVAAT